MKVARDSAGDLPLQIAHGRHDHPPRADRRLRADLALELAVQTPAIKSIYGLAAGCTVVLKPSDASPISAIMLAEVFEKAGVPKGVFNLVIGRGRVVGEALSNHPDVDMISFTGSTGVRHQGRARPPPAPSSASRWSSGASPPTSS